MIKLRLPFPPSINHYWLLRKGGGRFITPKGKLFRTAVYAQVLMNVKRRQAFVNGEVVTVKMSIVPPDNRRRDMDNIFKALFDALTYSQIWKDDSQIKRIDAIMRLQPDEEKKGYVIVEIEEFNDDEH